MPTMNTPPCHECPAHCCRYFALEIDEPEDLEDFEKIKWFVVHEDTHVFVEDGDWYLEVQKKCTHLGDDNRCQIYERRPQICRDYGLDEDGEVDCHMSGREYDYDHEFHTIEDVEKYVEAHFASKKRKRKVQSH